MQAQPMSSYGVCLTVCPSCSYILSKQINISSKIFSPSVSQAILVFAWQYSDGNPLTGTSNAGGVGRNRYSEPISHAVNAVTASCCQHDCRPIPGYR